MLKNIFNKLFSKKDYVEGSLIPIVKCIKFSHGMNEDVIRKQVVNRMIPELMNYIVWEIEEDNGVSKLTGRIDVLHRN